MAFAIAAVVITAIAAAPVRAQPQEGVRVTGRSMSQMALDVWNDMHGLPQNSVQAVAQSRDGYLWLGTQQGLVRFDGERFTVFDRLSDPAIQRPYIWALEADATGGIWIGTEEDGLLHLQDGTIRQYTTKDGLPSPYVRAIHLDSRGVVWIGTVGGGLARVLPDGRIEVVDSTRGYKPKNIFSITEDSRGDVWVGSGQGATRFRGDSLTTIGPAAGLPGVPLAMTPAREGIWIGTGQGSIALLRNDSIVEKYGTADGIPQGPIMSLRADLDGTVWIGSQAGVARLREGRIEAYGDTTRMDPFITSIEIDHEGSVWLGTYSGGLARLRETPFTPIGEPEGLSDDMVVTLMQTPDGVMWIGSASGVDRIEQGRTTRINAANGGLPFDFMFAIAQAPDGTMWFGTNGGLASWRNGRSELFGQASGLASGQIRGIAFDETGSMWLATPVGLQRFRPGPPQLFTTQNGLPDDFILSVVRARAGGLWIATRKGLTRYQNGTFTNYGTEAGFHETGVGTLMELEDGTIWFGGPASIGRFRNGRAVIANREHGACDDGANGILMDRQGRIWFSTNKGIHVLEQEQFDKFASGATSQLPCHLYDRAHGMRSRETNGATNPSAWRTADGRLWFPTLKGLVVVDPENLETGLIAPPVAIEAFTHEGTRVTRVPEELPAGTRTLDIEYTALTFVAPERVQFRHRLVGLDDQWYDAGNRRIASYTNLKPGHYTFEVMAANAEGEWNQTPATHSFVIAAYFWQTRWFQALVALALAGLAFMLYRYRVQGLEKRQGELLALVDERSRAEARYRDLFENAADAVFTTDATGRFTALNHRAEELTGYTAEEARNLNLRDLLPRSADGERVANDWLAGEADGAETIEIVAKDGTRVPVEVSTRIVRDGDNAVGMQALARDVRERAALERQLRQSQKMQAVGQLAGGVAHDFNNLLTVIRGNGEILLNEDNIDNSARDDLEQIVAAAERASALTRQLLAFSRKQIVHPTVIDLNDLVRGLEKMTRRLIGEDIEIRLQLTSEQCNVLVDPGQLEQVLVNLAVNARDAMPKGGSLTIATSHIAMENTPHAPVFTTSGQAVLLTVTDTGTGMDPATQARIFEPFFTTKDPGKGTGLGLSTVYGIIEQAGGQIVCQSQQGRGTSFRIYLPAVAPGEQNGVDPKTTSAGWSGKETILLVEDDPSVRVLTSRLLKRFGYSVIETGDGAEAIRVADAHAGPIELLLTDMVMPGMNGIELAAQLQQKRSDLRALLMSGYTEDEIVRRGLHDHDVAFLQKPFTADDLGRAVREAIDRDVAAAR